MANNKYRDAAQFIWINIFNLLPGKTIVEIVVLHSTDVEQIQDQCEFIALISAIFYNLFVLFPKLKLRIELVPFGGVCIMEALNHMEVFLFSQSIFINQVIEWT